MEEFEWREGILLTPAQQFATLSDCPVYCFCFVTKMEQNVTTSGVTQETQNSRPANPVFLLPARSTQPGDGVPLFKVAHYLVLGSGAIWHPQNLCLP